MFQNKSSANEIYIHYIIAHDSKIEETHSPQEENHLEREKKIIILIKQFFLVLKEMYPHINMNTLNKKNILLCTCNVITHKQSVTTHLVLNSPVVASHIPTMLSDYRKKLVTNAIFKSP